MIPVVLSLSKHEGLEALLISFQLPACLDPEQNDNDKFVIGFFKIAAAARLSLLALRRAIGFLGFACLFACGSSSPGPLSIKMFNPKTQTTLTCEVRGDIRSIDTSVLAATVETCARQLESRGFVRPN